MIYHNTRERATAVSLPAEWKAFGPKIDQLRINFLRSVGLRQCGQRLQPPSPTIRHPQRLTSTWFEYLPRPFARPKSFSIRYVNQSRVVRQLRVFHYCRASSRPQSLCPRFPRQLGDIPIVSSFIVVGVETLEVERVLNDIQRESAGPNSNLARTLRCFSETRNFFSWETRRRAPKMRFCAVR